MTVIIQNEKPPNAVMDDFQALNNVVKVERCIIDDGPDSGWTMNLEGDTDREKFDDIADLVEDAVSNTSDVRRIFDRESRSGWLIQLRY